MKKAKYRFIFIRQIFTIICVFFMLTTGLSSIYASESIFKKDNSSDEERLNLMDSAKDKIDDALKSTKSKLSDMKETLSTYKNKINIKNLTESIPTFTNFLLTNSKSNTSFRFYTNYNGNENSTEIKFFRTVKIDVNDDAKEDISVRYIIYPSFDLRSFSLAINVRLIIRKLKDFPDENASFDAFLEFYFPSLGLLKNISGNRIRFGYESPKDEQIPNRCVVTYKILPNLLKPHKKMEHKLSIRPGGITRESKIVLLFSSTQFKDENIFSEEKYRVVFNPATNAAIKIGGNKKSDEPNFEFEKASFTKSIIDIYFSYMKNDTYTYLYCLGVPKHLLLTLKHGKNGYVEFDSFEDPIEEIGICDDIKNPKNKLFFAEFPKKARFSWSRDLFPPVELKLSLYSEGEGIKLGSHLSLPNSGIKDLDFIINSHETLDFNLDLDMKNGYLEIDRSNSNLSLYIDVNGMNGSTFTGSMDIKRFTESPFRLFYDKIIDGEGGLETYISGKKLEIKNLHLKANSSIIGGILKVDIDSCLIGPKYKEKVSKMSFNISLKIKSANVYARVCLNVIRGIKISNPVIQYNDLKITPGDIDISGNRSFCYEFLLNGTIEFDFGDNFSWGYIKLYGAAAFLIDGTFERNGKKGGVYGLISLKSYKGSLNISWHTEIIDGNETRVFNVKGAALLALKDFHIWFADILDINIPSFNGSLVLKNASQKSGNLSLDLKGAGSSFEHIGFSFSTDDLVEKSKNLILNITMENIKMESRFSALLNLGWVDYNLSNLYTDVSAGFNLSIENLSIMLIINQINFSFISDNLMISGLVEFDFNSSDIDKTKVEGPIIKIGTTDSKFHIHISSLLTGVLNIYNFTIDSETVGTAYISLFEIITYEELNQNKLDLNLSSINTTLIGIYAEDGNFNLNIFEIGRINGSFVRLIPGTFGMILGFLENASLKIENLSIKNGISLINLSLTLPLSDLIKNLSIPNILANILNGAYNICINNKFSKTVDNILKMNILRVNLSGLTLGAISELIKQYLNINISFGEYNESYLSFFIENLSMSEGVFDLYLDFFSGFKLKINKTASIFKNVDIGAGFLDVAYGLISFEGSFDKLLLDINNGVNNQSDLVNGNYTETYVLVDTDNETSSIPDLEIWVESDFINALIELLKKKLGISLPKVKSDIGVRIFNNATFKADQFKIIKFKNNTSNETRISNTGYLYAEGGDIWIYFNGTWRQLAGGKVSIIVEPGHARLFIDEDIGVPGMTWQLEDGTNFSIGGSFFVGLDEITIDIWWNLVNGSYLFVISGEGSSNFDVKLSDFYVNINKEFELNGTKIKSLSFSVGELSIVGSGSISLFADNLNLNNLTNITKSNATIKLDIAASIETIGLKNLVFSGEISLPEKKEKNEATLSFKDIDISGNIDLSLAGDLSIKAILDQGNISAEILLDQGLYLFAGLEIEAEIDNKYYIYVAGDLSVEGKGSLIFKEGNFTVSGSITKFGLGLEGSAPLSLIGQFINISMSGKVDISASVGANIVFTLFGSNLSDIANLSLDVSGSANALIDLTLSNFEIKLENILGGNITVSGKTLSLDIGGKAKFSLSRKAKGKIKLTLTEGVLGLSAKDFSGVYNSVNNTNLKGIYIDGDGYLDIDAGGYIQFIVDISNLSKSGINLDKIELNGFGKLSITDFSFAAIQDVNNEGELVEGITVSGKNLHLNGYGEFIRTVFEVHNGTHEWEENYTKIFLNAEFAEFEKVTISSENLSLGNFTIDGELTMSGEGDGGLYFELEDPLESVEKNQTIKLGLLLNGISVSLRGRSPNKPFIIESDQFNVAFDEIFVYGSCDLEIWLNGPNILNGNFLDIFKAIQFVNTQPSFGGIDISNLNIKISPVNLGFEISLNELEIDWTSRFNFNITLQKTAGKPNSTILDNIFIDLSMGDPDQVFTFSFDIQVNFDSEIADGYIHLVINSFESKGHYAYLHAGNSDNPNTTNPYIEIGGSHNRTIQSIDFEFDIDGTIKNQSISINASLEVNNIISNGEIYASILFDKYLFDELPSDITNITQWINHFLDHFENITVRWNRAFSYDNISLNIHSASFGNFSFTDIPVYFPGRSSEGAGEIILSFSGNPFNISETNFRLEGYFSKPVTISFVDRWTHPLGLFNIKIGTLEISEGEFAFSLMNNVSSRNDGNLIQDFYLSLYSTCKLEINLVKVEFFLFDLDILKIGGLEMNGGSMTIDLHRVNWSRFRMEFTSYEMKQDSIDFFLLKIAGKDIIRGIYWDLDCPYLLVEWDIESIPEFPWSRGYIHIDSNGQPVSLTTNSGDFIIVDIINIFGFIIAYDFNISWGSYEKGNGFNIIDTEGSLESDCTIEILIDGIWRRLWPIGASQNHPPTKPQTPDGPASGQSGQSLTYSTSSTDPDGDEIKYGWDWNNDGVVEWWVTSKSRSHIWYNNGEKTYSIRVKAKDEYGLESEWSDSFDVTISGGVTGSWKSPIDHNDPESDWENEDKSYDDDTSTCAISKQCSMFPKWVWTEPLELIFHNGPDENCPKVGKIRFKAWYDQSWCDKVDIDAYRYNEYSNKWEWVYLYHGKYYDHEDDWNVIHHQHTYSLKINKIRIKFYVKETWNGGQGISADLYELDYWKINE